MVTGSLDDTRHQKSQTEALSDRTKAVRNRVDGLVAKSSDPNARRAIEAALSQISDLESRLAAGIATPTEIANFAGALSSVQSVASAVEGEASTVSDHLVRDALELANAEARRSVQSISDDLYRHKVLDPYLRFSSPEDENAYRHREAEGQKAVQAELAKETPAGNLNAAILTKAQLDDAAAHGAKASPDFDKLAAQNDLAIDELKIVVARTAETNGVGQNFGATATPGQPVAPKAGDNLSEVMAALKAAGVTTLEPAPSVAHGLTADARSTSGSVGRN